MAVDPLSAFLTFGGALLGGAGGSQSVPSTTTQRIEQVRPTLTPEEQALQNYMINQMYGNIGQTSSLQGLIQQYYGGGGYQPMVMGAGPSGYQQMPTQYTPDQTRQQYEQQVVSDRWGSEILPALQQISQLYGGRSTEYKPPGNAYATLAKMGQSKEQLANIAKQLGMSVEDTNKLYNEWILNPQSVEQRYVQPAQTAQSDQQYTGMVGEFVQQNGRLPTNEEWDQMVAGTELRGQTATQPTNQYSPLTSIMQQSPEQLGAQYDILRQQGEKGIEDWYNQAQREFEQRGIGQYGGYMGSPTERDLGSLLARRGEMQTNLGQQLGLSQLQAQQQLPYSQLQALEDVRRFEAQNALAQQAPWIQAAQNIYAIPWGKTTTATQTQPGVGILPGAISGAYTGAGLYNQLSGWGQQNQPATSYGGMTNIPSTYGYNPSGYEGSMLGYAW